MLTTVIVAVVAFLAGMYVGHVHGKVTTKMDAIDKKMDPQPDKGKDHMK